jgi:hypothetical protein
MSFSNEEWVELITLFLGKLRVEQPVTVSLPVGKPLFVKIELDDPSGTKTSVFMPKKAIVGESERTIRKVICNHLAAIGVEFVNVQEAVADPNVCRPNEDGSMSDGEAAKLRGMLKAGVGATASSYAHRTTTQAEAEVALGDDGANLLSKLGNEQL